MLKFSKYEVLEWVVFVNSNTEILDDNSHKIVNKALWKRVIWKNLLFVIVELLFGIGPETWEAVFHNVLKNV